MRGRLRRWISTTLVVAGLATLASGCATSAQRAEEEQRIKQSLSHLDLGADHLQNNRLGLALREFLLAEERDPMNPRIHYALGEGYWARKRLDDAERHFRRALEIHPGHHDSRMDLTVLLIALERYEEAIAESQVLIDDPTFPAPWQALANRGVAELQLARLPAARQSLEEALEFNPGFWKATLSLAKLEAQAGRRLEAVGLYQELLSQELSPSAESEASYRLAEVYISLGKRRRAMGHLTAAVARHPGGPWARKSEEYLQLLR